jgi:hypothetical protein
LSLAVFLRSVTWSDAAGSVFHSDSLRKTWTSSPDRLLKSRASRRIYLNMISSWSSKYSS